MKNVADLKSSALSLLKQTMSNSTSGNKVSLISGKNEDVWLNSTKQLREKRQLHLEPHSNNFRQVYLARTIHLVQQTLWMSCVTAVCCMISAFCETVCYPLINPWNMEGKYSKANLSLALKMDYFFHVMFCVCNKEIIPLMKNRLEATLKQFMHCNRISLIISAILQLHYKITTAIIFSNHPLNTCRLNQIITETEAFSYNTKHLETVS